jgi:hypothetical protein
MLLDRSDNWWQGAAQLSFFMTEAHARQDPLGGGGGATQAELNE